MFPPPKFMRPFSHHHRPPRSRKHRPLRRRGRREARAPGRCPAPDRPIAARGTTSCCQKIARNPMMWGPCTSTSVLTSTRRGCEDSPGRDRWKGVSTRGGAESGLGFREEVRSWTLVLVCCSYPELPIKKSMELEKEPFRVHIRSLDLPIRRDHVYSR